MGSTDWISILPNWEKRSGSLRDVLCVCVVKDASTKEMQLCHWPNDVHIVTLDLGVHNIETQEEEQGVVRSQGELWQKMKKDDAESQRRPLMASLVRKCLGSYFQK